MVSLQEEVEQDDYERYRERNRRQQGLFSELLDALQCYPNGIGFPHLAFAASKVINPSEGFSLKSFHVEGAGELQLPLSTEDADKLRKVCVRRTFAKSLAFVDDDFCGHQVEASKVSFPRTPTFLSNTIQTLAMESVRKLGLNGAEMQLEAHLQKLLVYEGPDFFTFLKDTEEDKGIIATLLLQLPTEDGYGGGKVSLKHNNEVEEFDCHMVSAFGFCYTVFLPDCLQKLEEITYGTKLCLAFSLVKHGFSLDHGQREFIPRQVRKAEAALEPWLKEVTERKFEAFGRKLVIPLEHKYTESNLSFAGLKKGDRILAEVMKNCRDGNKDDWLDLHLCRVIRSRFGSASPCDDCDNPDCPDPDHHSMTSSTIEELFAEIYMTECDGKPASVAFNRMRVDEDKELVRELWETFYSEPDNKVMGKSDQGDRFLEYFYHRAALVAWPKALSASIACEEGEGGVYDALDFLEKTLKVSDPNFGDQLRQIICYCEKNVGYEWDCFQDPHYDPLTSRLLNLCVRANMPEDVVHILQLLSTTSDKIYRRDRHDGKDPCHRIGVKNAEVAEAIASAVQVFGWELLTKPVTDLVTGCAFTQVECFVDLTEQLVFSGNMDAAECVARTALGVFETRIAELESQKMPECPGNSEARHVKCSFKTFCEATFADAMDKCRENQENIKRWRLEQENFRAYVPGASLRSVTRDPLKWRQPKSKRRRVRSIRRRG